MKSIQMTALILWVAIFLAAAFFAGQFLASKDIFDITSFITGEKTEEKDKEEEIKDEVLANDIVINKIGQETVRIGLNVVSDYFSEYYKEYINYIINNVDKYSGIEKITINDTLASDYVFYAVSRNIDELKYDSKVENDKIVISESEINSFVDKFFEKNIDEAYKKDGKYGYDRKDKIYSVEKVDEHEEYAQELQKVENITSNELVLTYSYNKAEENKTIKLRCLYKGGRYIVTEVEI